jgi:hypothetical protein
MTFTAINPPNLESILTSFGQLPFNLEIKTTTTQTYDLPLFEPLVDYVMNIAHTSDSTGTLTVVGTVIPVGSMCSFVYSHQTDSWYASTTGGGSGITALTGDVTASGVGSVPATLATVNPDVGSFTNASITVNAKGLITAASSNSSSSVSISLVTISTTQESTTNTGYVPSSFLTRAFALSNPSNIVKITVSLGTEVSGYSGIATIFKDGSDTDSTGEGLWVSSPGGNPSYIFTQMSFVTTVSPGDTASHTYTLYYKISGGGNTLYINVFSGPAMMLIEEIPA